eukprot:TRINITY_DN24896_c0_g1_i1.p1 TRINITY_DN24896_c0_g1~~TRINITY_DN24896_c0_g1_i1.p1  ORF type:complete len:111 (+),score=19.97 TRINITY_DN24896_c0_g1_i1:41-334(+)
MCIRDRHTGREGSERRISVEQPHLIEDPAECLRKDDLEGAADMNFCEDERSIRTPEKRKKPNPRGRYTEAFATVPPFEILMGQLGQQNCNLKYKHPQ